MTPTFWFDLLNPSDVHFFAPLIRHFESSSSVEVTVRDRAESRALADLKGLRYRMVGRDSPNAPKKVTYMGVRTLQLLGAPHFDVALGFENPTLPVIARMRRKRSVQFLDNDLKLAQQVTFQSLETRLKLRADLVVVPAAFNTARIREFARRGTTVSTFSGYKEDIYLADFRPDPAFATSLPFVDYVIVRPEALGSFYVSERRSLVPEILDALRDVNVVYLPRDPGDARYAHGTSAFIPKTPLDGLNLAWHARAVLTGSGTFAREAATMGTPSLSFFPNELLTVDRSMVESGKMRHTRDVHEITSFVENALQRKPDRDVGASRKVQAEVFAKVEEFLEQR